MKVDPLRPTMYGFRLVESLTLFVFFFWFSPPTSPPPVPTVKKEVRPSINHFLFNLHTSSCQIVLNSIDGDRLLFASDTILSFLFVFIISSELTFSRPRPNHVTATCAVWHAHQARGSLWSLSERLKSRLYHLNWGGGFVSIWVLLAKLCWRMICSKLTFIQAKLKRTKSLSKVAT